MEGLVALLASDLLSSQVMAAQFGRIGDDEIIVEVMHVKLFLDAIDIYHVEQRFELTSPVRDGFAQVHILQCEPGLTRQEFQELHVPEREGVWGIRMPEE